MPNRKAVFELFLVSALGLFAELVFIRWVASELRVVAFYKNLALLGAYLGLGLGFAWHRRQPDSRGFERAFFPILAAVALSFLLIARTPLGEIILLNPANAQEYFWAGTLPVIAPWVRGLLQIMLYVFLFGLFAVLAALFILLGHLTASRFTPFRPLAGYTINVAGSLFGILVYAAISYLGWPPPAWFLLSGAAGIYFLPRAPRRKFALQSALALLPALLTLLWPTGYERTVWSPYYRIDLNPIAAGGDSSVILGYDLSVNQAWHQRLTNLDPAFVAKNYSAAPEYFDSMRAQYDTPFRAAASLKNVLVVGAGTGNDVAGALRAGAGHVTAVEIDPVILQLGRELHPERPYADSSRVTLVVEDARTFFRRDTGKFDLIVFGLLDSHTLFASASSVRLDNFVYTLESLADARRLLAEGGLLALSFGSPPGNQWVNERLYRNLTDVFGHPPQVYQYPSTDILFLIRQDSEADPLVADPLVLPRPDFVYRADLAPVTDDWPYLYLGNPGLPATYAIMILGIAVMSLLLVRRVLPDFRQWSPFYFLMGAAFFLLETRSITEMALLFGSTWMVNAAVIAAILVMILLANALVETVQWENPLPVYVLLGLSLLFNFLVPSSSFLGWNTPLRVPLAALAQALPLFFAGVIFAVVFRRTKSIETALGSNMVGAVLGGLCEYASLAMGIRVLIILAFVFYMLSAAALAAGRRSKTGAV
jgi:SAM-dependent methyltransferase